MLRPLVRAGLLLALAAAIQRFRHEPATRQRMGQASRARALAEFDQRLVFEQTRAVYEELRGEAKD